jgi:hypothetical protein
VIEADVLEVVIAFCRTSGGGLSGALATSMSIASLATETSPLPTLSGTQMRS